MADQEDDYEVGYRKPPREGRFVKGTSGNPNGRPKGSKSVASMFNTITRELIHVHENGQKRTMTKIEAILYQVINLALKGDARAMREILQWHRIFEASEQDEDSSSVPDERDEALMKSVLRRIQQMQTASADETQSKSDNDLDKE